ncbi:MAG: serine/threonine-protein kinase [Acidobacteriota bacterium]
MPSGRAAWAKSTARDTRLGREVAVKILSAGGAIEADRLARFEQEARAVAALNHPNIVALHDIGTYAPAGSAGLGSTPAVPASPYLVIELLDGATLRDRLAGGALLLRKAVDYARQIALGLAAAHEKGIVHRDLKPENVFVTADERVKILDFGLAKLTEAEPAAAGMGATGLGTTPRHTIPGTVLGTAGYMAPEQVRGTMADYRADLFAFGAVLYEMLSGQRAFGGDTTMDVMMAVAREDPPSLATVRPDLPPSLVRLVERCLEKDPAARFQSTRDLAFAIEGATSAPSGTTSAVAVTAGGWPGRRGLVERRWVWGLTGLAAGAVVASLAGVIWPARTGELPQPVTFMLPSESPSFRLPGQAPAQFGRWSPSPDSRWLLGSELLPTAGRGSS